MNEKVNMNSGIRDNHTRGTVGAFIQKAIKPGSHVSAVSAYFTVYTYEVLKASLDNIEKMNFLFGEPRFVRALDPARSEKRAFMIDSSGLRLSNVLQQKRVARECAEWIKSKVDIRSIKQSNLLHGKMYHIIHQGVEKAILGSSNFTPPGLGLVSGGGNIELNLIVDSDRDRTDLKQWFDNLWSNDHFSIDVKEEVLKYLAQVYQNHSPEFIYFKTLFHLFERYLDDVDRSGDRLARTTLFESHIWNALYEFQKDSVKGIINKILAYNGCILADSVGLGKTYSALAVIKFFELKNERVLVLCPKKLRGNWTVFRSNDLLNPFLKDRFRFDVLSHTDLSREKGESGGIKLDTLNWGNYDLVVIDESHNFRNNTPGKKDEDGNVIRKSRYRRLLDDIVKSGIRTKVLLLSATPVNNDLKDLRNQIYFISAGEEAYFAESLGIPDVKECLRKAQGHFTTWSKQETAKRRTADLLSRLGSDFFKLLDQLTIARARKHILKYYAHEMERIGQFPKRLKPITLHPDIDREDKFMSYDKLSKEIDDYKLSLFNPSRFLREDLPKSIRNEYERRVGNFTQSQREDFLIGMMKVNFLKRLESSVNSFKLTMGRTIEKIEKLETHLKDFKKSRGKNDDFEFSEIDPTSTTEDDDEIREAWEVGKKLTYKLDHLDVDKWLKALKHDERQINGLYIQAKDVTPDRDEKLLELKKLIAKKIKLPKTNRNSVPNRKILLFTAFADTAEYLYDHLHKWAMDELSVCSAVVTGTGKNDTNFKPAGYKHSKEYNHILTNFSPGSKMRSQIPSMPQNGEIDLLIATDCISEGQNLQDCDFLINYDIHWNPVRIIQRFGRIDRIGSLNDSVQLVNFWPTANLDNYINLKHRVEARMALVDVAATLDDNLLRQEDLEDLITDDLHYRDRQLKKLRDEVLDIEDLDETISLTEFSLDDFRVDLLKFLESNRVALEDSPLGLYTVVPTYKDLFTTITPGVIYCLRQKADSTKAPQNDHINPLQPYYLVYVRDDGNVRLNFVYPKQILTIFRQLCSGKSSVYEKLCDAFDQETNNGANMSHYDNLLQRCVVAISSKFKNRIVGGLQDKRSFVIPEAENQPNDTSDFELVTWLVIKSEKPRK
ncbi:MAG: helicase-related protein [Planctomycetes bacterium]|nr:helicase-related protein [Planctomycetota bacterium]